MNKHSLRIKNSILPLMTVSIMSVSLLVFITHALASSLFSSEWAKTDFSKKSVDLSEIKSGGPPKDGIPAIDHPKMVTVKAAQKWLHPQEPVIVFEAKNTARAYPLQILMYHEIVNDTFLGQPIAVTFCPLCNASIVFDRRVKGQVLDFGTTGRLRMSDLVMYDRQTESWWQQFTGEAIVGEYTGLVLNQLASKIVAFEDFRRAFPDGEVLSRKTGYSKSYGRNPYGGYDRIGQSPFLFTDPVDRRLPAMERVISISHNSRYKIYPFEQLNKTPLIQDVMGDLAIVIFHKKNVLSALDKAQINESRLIQAAVIYNRTLDDKLLDFEFKKNKIVDKQTGSEWDLLGRATKGPLKGKQLESVVSGIHFAFAWLAFNPETEIHQTKN